jgi:hypothetical protein
MSEVPLWAPCNLTRAAAIERLRLAQDSQGLGFEPKVLDSTYVAPSSLGRSADQDLAVTILDVPYSFEIGPV